MEFLEVRLLWLVTLLLVPWRILLCLSKGYSEQMSSGHVYLEPVLVTSLFLWPLDTVLKLWLSLQNALPQDTLSHLLRPWGNCTSHQQKCYGVQSEFAFYSEPPLHSIHSDEPLVDANKRYCKTEVSVGRGKISQCMLIPYFFLTFC